MKKILVAALAACSVSIGNAQKVKVTWGEESKSELDYNSFVNGKGTDMIKLCLEKNGGGFRKLTYTPILTRYNDKIVEKAEKKIEVSEDGISFNQLLSIKKKLYMFTSKYDRDSKSTIYFCQPVNIETLNPEGKNITLGSFDAIKKSSQSTVGFELSQDSSKIMMFGLAPVSKKENEKYYMSVYDADMNKLWDNTVELPYKDKYVSVLDNLVTNDGKVCVIIKHYDQEVSKESVRENGSRVPSYKTKFLMYEGKNAKPAEFILNTGDKFVHTLQLTNDKKNNLTLFGLYKNKYNGHVNGYFTATVNTSTKEVAVGKMEEFPSDVVELVKMDKQGSDKEKDPGLNTEFKLEKVVDRGDGSRDYILEYQYSELRTRTNGNYSYTYWFYKMGDIVDICKRADGKTIITRIPKLQISSDTRIYSSFEALGYKDKLLLFYNDDRDNLERDINKKPDDVIKFNKGVLLMAAVDAKGNVDRSGILDYKEMKLTTAIRESQQLDERRLGLYAMKGFGLFSGAKDMIGILEIN